MPAQADAFVGADEGLRHAIAVNNDYLSLDPTGWFTFGAVGIWLLIVGVLALRQKALPAVLAYLGIAGGILLWLIPVGSVFDLPVLISITAGLGGVIVAPIFFIWVGSRLRKPAAVPEP